MPTNNSDAIARRRLDETIAALKAAKLRETELEAALKEQRDIINLHEETTLPELFAMLGMRKMQTIDGGKLELGLFTSGTLTECPDEQKKEAADWLVANGYEDVVKVFVSAQFGKGDREAAIEAARKLRESNSAVSVNVDEGAHFMTLWKICRERVRDGLPIPLSTFNVTVSSRVKYTPPKQRT